MAVKKGLGRGLEALLATPDSLGGAQVQIPTPKEEGAGATVEEPAPAKRLKKKQVEPKNQSNQFAAAEVVTEPAENSKDVVQKDDTSGSSGQLRYLPPEYLERSPFQPRRDINPDTLEELAQSIRTQGIMQPIVVRKMDAKTFQIIAGERRWRASQLVGLDSIPCLVRDVTDEAAMAMALIENLQREDLNPIEESVALQKLQSEYDMTHAEIAQLVGKSRAAVSNSLRLLQLNSVTRKMVEHGDLEMGHARALLSIKGDLQAETAKMVVAKGLSVRQTEALVKRVSAQSEHSAIASSVKSVDPNIQSLERELAERLGAAVKILHSEKGKGRLVIRYHSLAELDGIIDCMKR